MREETATLALAIGVLFVVSLGYGLVVPILPHLAPDAGEGTLGLVFAVFAGAKIAFQVPAGVQVDRLGAERVLRAGVIAYTLSLLGLLSGSTTYVLVARGVEGAATGLVYVATLALVARGSPERVGRRMGLVGGIGMSGLLLGPVLGAALLPLGPAAPVLAGFVAGVAATLWVLRARPRRGDARVDGLGLGALVRLGRDPGFVGRMAPVAYNKVAFTAFQGLAPLLGPQLLGVGERGVAGMFVAAGLGFGLMQPVGGWLGDRFDVRRLQLALAGPLILSVAAMAWLPWFWPAMLAWIALSSLVFALALREIVACYPDQRVHGRVIGGYHTLTDLGTIVGPLIFLPIYGVIGAQVFLAMALAALPLALVYVRLGRAPVRPVQA